MSVHHLHKPSFPIIKTSMIYLSGAKLRGCVQVKEGDQVTGDFCYCDSDDCNVQTCDPKDCDCPYSDPNDCDQHLKPDGIIFSAFLTSCPHLW